MVRTFAWVLAVVIGLSSASWGFEAGKDGPKAPVGKKRPTPAERLKKLDKDGDGKLSMAEFTAGAKDATKSEARFKKLDKNNDGFITLDEMQAGQGESKK